MGAQTYTTAELFKQAEDGDAKARFTLGSMYLTGNGMPLNDAEGLKWTTFAAQQGYGPAQFALGNIYHEGHAVRRSDAEAAKWFQRAAVQGVPGAQAALEGLFYKPPQSKPAIDVAQPDTPLIPIKANNVAPAEPIAGNILRDNNRLAIVLGVFIAVVFLLRVLADSVRSFYWRFVRQSRLTTIAVLVVAILLTGC